jgi:pSer/pThr/pTyr-binding forkhead associated (FHA) protein
MSQSIQEQFGRALGVRRGLRFAVTGPDGATVEAAVDRPCAVIGRGEEAHVALSDQTVSFRHAYVQAIGNRLLCVDLFGPNTVRYEDSGQHGWVSARRPFRVGVYRVCVQDEGWENADGSIRSPLDCKTRDDSGSEYGVMPEVELRLLNPGMEHMAWPINRVVTLVGRDERCRIACADETVSKAHCSLLLLPSGLWVVDLLGKGGTFVDQTPVSVGLLPPNGVLQIGGYRMQAIYQSPPAVLPPPTVERVEFLTKLHRIFKVTWDGDTLIVLPQGRSREFRYQDIQVEANTIIAALRTQGFRNVLVDFSAVKLTGSLIVDSITQFCRVAPGLAALCGCSPEQYSALRDLNLITLWPCYPTRGEALRVFRTAAAPALAATQGCRA